MSESNNQGQLKPEGNEVSSGSRILSDVDTTTPGKQPPEMDLITPDGCDRHTPRSEPPSPVIHENSESSATLPNLDLPSPLGPREISTDIMNVIRKVIRQEYKRLDTDTTGIASRAHAQDNGCGHRPMSNHISVNPTGLGIVPDSCNRSLSQTGVVTTKGTQDQSDDGSCSPATTVPSGDDIDRTPVATPTPRSASHQAVEEESRLGSLRSGGVNKSNDNVSLARRPTAGSASTVVASTAANKTPWALHRRFSSLGVEYGDGWGVLFTEDGFPTTRCGEVFRGLARCLVSSAVPW